MEVIMSVKQIQNITQIIQAKQDVDKLEKKTKYHRKAWAPIQPPPIIPFSVLQNNDKKDAGKLKKAIKCIRKSKPTVPPSTISLQVLQQSQASNTIQAIKQDDDKQGML